MIKFTKPKYLHKDVLKCHFKIALGSITIYITKLEDGKFKPEINYCNENGGDSTIFRSSNTSFLEAEGALWDAIDDIKTYFTHSEYARKLDKTMNKLMDATFDTNKLELWQNK